MESKQTNENKEAQYSFLWNSQLSSHIYLCDLHSISNLYHIFVFEEVMENGGIGEHIAYTLLKRGYKGGFKVTAIKDGFVPQSTVSSALKKHQLDVDSVVDIILSGLGRGG